MLRHFLPLLLLFPLAAVGQQDCTLDKVTVTIQSSAAPSLPGQTVKFGVFVEPITGVATPMGAVEIFDASEDLGSFPLSQAQTSFTRTFNNGGAHVMQAYYSGDFNFCPGSGIFGQQVDRLTPSLTLTSSASSTFFGAPVTLTAKITPGPPSGVAPPTGPVQFLEGTTVLGRPRPCPGRPA